MPVGGVKLSASRPLAMSGGGAKAGFGGNLLCTSGAMAGGLKPPAILNSTCCCPTGGV